jgi:hypothetical protein
MTNDEEERIQNGQDIFIVRYRRISLPAPIKRSALFNVKFDHATVTSLVYHILVS